MNIYALFPLIAIIAYIPLLAATISSRPWQKRHELFILFLVPAMLWSLVDYLFRSNFLPDHSFFLFRCILVMFTWMAVQLYCFASSFFGAGQGRWLPFAYASLVLAVALIAMGYLPEGVITSGVKVYPDYGIGIFFIVVPLSTLLVRAIYVFWKRLRTLDNPVLYNQIISLMLGLLVLAVFTIATLLPWGREYPISHFGNLVNAFILSYAAIRHQLVDIRIVIRQGAAWVVLGIIGAASFWILLVTLHAVFNFALDLTAMFVATAVATMVVIFVVKLRGFFFELINRFFQGETFDYRQKLYDFANRIQNVFSLREQGGELLALVIRAVDCKRACLLFPEIGGGGFSTQLVEPDEPANPFWSLKLDEGNPILEYLRRERKPLVKESISILPELRGLWEQEKDELKQNEVELFMPLISRDRLIAILVLGRKQTGKYILEDLGLLGDVNDRVAVSMEKEYLREQLREREEELSVINRSSAILTSSLDIQAIYGSFIDELKTVMDVSWAAISLIEENDLYFLAIYSDIGSAWQEGERIPIKGTATEWVADHSKTMIEPDLTKESRFDTAQYHIRQGVRSIVYLPLIAKGEVIGSLIVASVYPNAFNQRHVALLEQLASQIAMPVENTRLFAKAEEKARIDELTGLLNRRALDEMITSEIGRHSRYGGVFSIITLDLDSFKAFNDNYGHLAGDKLLRQIGGIIKSAIRSADQAFRYGGDEFAIFLPHTAIDAAKHVAERVRRQVLLRVKAGDIRVTASLGLATWPADGLGPNEILAAADAALYHAKRSGGNQSHCASGTLLQLSGTDERASSDGDKGTLDTIYALAAIVDARDHYTRSHSKKVSEYALALGEALKLDTAEMSRLETCALLHDIGKIGISDEILAKPGKLTGEDWEVVKTHPQLGASIVSRAPKLTSCVAGILHHHERYDGSGYPKGMKGEEIPRESRILAIADAFAAMTCERPYSEVLSMEKALEEIKRGSGTQFDPHLVDVFLSIARTTTLVPEEK